LAIDLKAVTHTRCFLAKHLLARRATDFHFIIHGNPRQ
jgi:hypothetical protein